MSSAITIGEDGITAGRGTIEDGRIECDAILGADQGAAERAYDAIEAAIAAGQDSVVHEGVRYHWTIEG